MGNERELLKRSMGQNLRVPKGWTKGALELGAAIWDKLNETFKSQVDMYNAINTDRDGGITKIEMEEFCSKR